MTSFDWCKRCECRRIINGYRNKQDYIDNGWVEIRTTTESISNKTTRLVSTVSEWLCPVCAEEEDKERRALMNVAKITWPETKGPYGGTRQL